MSSQNCEIIHMVTDLCNCCAGLNGINRNFAVFHGEAIKINSQNKNKYGNIGVTLINITMPKIKNPLFLSGLMRNILAANQQRLIDSYT